MRYGRHSEPKQSFSGNSSETVRRENCTNLHVQPGNSMGTSRKKQPKTLESVKATYLKKAPRGWFARESLLVEDLR
jgi:hypothetical protein